MKLKEQLECKSKNFNEAVCTINSQKDEITVLKSENKKCLDKLDELEKVKKDLEGKLESVTLQNGTYEFYLYFGFFFYTEFLTLYVCYIYYVKCLSFGWIHLNIL